MVKTTKQIELENKINELAKLKEIAEKSKQDFDNMKNELLDELGLGNWETDRVKLCFTERTTKTTAWKSIAENNIEKAVLEKLVAENTTETISSLCKITPKLVLD